MGSAISKVQTAFGGVTGDVFVWVVFFKVDQFIMLILSAYVVAATFSAVCFVRFVT
jgi:hypothetical protein